MIPDIDLGLTIKTLKMVQLDLQGFLGRVSSSVAHPEYSLDDRLSVYELRSTLNSALSSVLSAKTILESHVDKMRTAAENEKVIDALEYLGSSVELSG